MTLFENLMTFTEADSTGRLLTKEEIGKLRKEIVLNSLYTHDYENSFGIDPHKVQDFFDGFVEYIWQDVIENYEDDEDTSVLEAEFEKHDNVDEIYDYYAYMFDTPPFTISDTTESLEEARQLSPSEFKRFKTVLNKHNPLKNIFVLHTGYPSRNSDDYTLRLPIYGAFKEYEAKSDYRGTTAANDGIGCQLFYININLLDSSIEIDDKWVDGYYLSRYINQVKNNSQDSAMKDIDAETVLNNIKTAVEQAKPELEKLVANKSFTYNLTGKAKKGKANDYDLSLGESLSKLKEDFDPSMPNWLMRAIKLLNTNRSYGGHKDFIFDISLDTAKWTVDKLPDKGTFATVTKNKIFALLLNAYGADSDKKKYIVYSPGLNLSYDETIMINNRERRINTMSLKALAPYVVEYAYIPDADLEYSKVKDKRKDRANAKSGFVDRINIKDRFEYGYNTKFDKSGYIVDPDKYVKLLAQIHQQDYANRLEDLYVVLTDVKNKIKDFISADDFLPDAKDATSAYTVDSKSKSRYFAQINDNYNEAIFNYKQALGELDNISKSKNADWSNTPAYVEFNKYVNRSEEATVKVLVIIDKSNK